MNHFLKNRPFLFVVACLIIFFVFFFVLFTPSFDTNDDFAMMSIANGFYYGKPLPDLIFTNVIIGLFLQFLYTAISNISWYPLYLYLFHFISLSILIYTFWVSRTSSIQFFFFIFSVFMFEIPMLMNLQFTTTSLLVGFAAIFYYFILTEQNKGNNLVPLNSGILLGAASFIRTKSFLATLVFSFPILLYAVKYFPIRKNTIFALGALCTFFLSQVTTNLYYGSHPAWIDYFDFNKIRGSLHDTPLLTWDENTRSILSKINWSENDFTMFASWFYTDRKIFSTDALKTFVKYRHVEAPLTLSLQKTFVKFSQSFSEELIYILLLFIFLILLSQKNKIRVFLLMLLLWYVIVSIYLINFVRFPPRVAIPAFLFLSLSLVLFSEVRPSPWFQNNRILSKIIIISSIILFIIFSPLHNSFSDSRTNDSNHRQFITVLTTLKELNPEGIFVTWGASLKYEDCSPFVTKKELPEINILGLGWRINSPPYLDFLKKLKIVDLYEAIATRKDLYLITKEELLPLYEEYMIEHYGKEVKLRSLLTLYNYDASVNESQKIKVFHNLN